MQQHSGRAQAGSGPQFPVRERVRVVAAVAARPSLWTTALRQWARHVPRDWWRHAPFLPVPPRRYVDFRLETAYGPDATARASDLVEYLEWCRRQAHPGRRS